MIVENLCFHAKIVVYWGEFAALWSFATGRLFTNIKETFSARQRGLMELLTLSSSFLGLLGSPKH